MSDSQLRTPGRLLDSPAEIGELVARVRSIAVLGIKTEEQASQPAYSVPRYARDSGYRVHPVPVYYPDVTTILGEPVHRSVAGIGARVDLVNVFRKPSDLPGHLDDLLAARPGAVWLQLGIRHDEFAATLTGAGIDVVQDRCLLVELRARGIGPSR